MTGLVVIFQIPSEQEASSGHKATFGETRDDTISAMPAVTSTYQQDSFTS